VKTSQFNNFKTGKKKQPQNSSINGLPQTNKQTKRHEHAEPPPDKKMQKVQFKLERKLLLTNFVHLLVNLFNEPLHN